MDFKQKSFDVIQPDRGDSVGKIFYESAHSHVS